MVRQKGLEPSRGYAPPAPQAGLSTNSNTGARESNLIPYFFKDQQSYLTLGAQQHGQKEVKITP